jgi:hypothetical protein
MSSLVTLSVIIQDVTFSKWNALGTKLVLVKSFFLRICQQSVNATLRLIVLDPTILGDLSVFH